MIIEFHRPAIFSILIPVVWLLLEQHVWATAYTTSGTGGSWETTTTWTPNGLPGQADTVEIKSGAAVYLDANESCGGLTIDFGGKIESPPNADTGSYTLSMYGNLAANNGSASFAKYDSNSHSLTFRFKSGSIRSWTGSGDTSGGKFTVTVDSGTTLDMSSVGFKLDPAGTLTFSVSGTLILGTQQINGNANTSSTFSLAAGGTLQTANTNGIVSGSAGAITGFSATALNTAANYVFNSSSAQVTAGLPSAANNLTISNASGVTLSGACTVNGALTLTTGLLKTTPANLLTLGSAGSIFGATANNFVSGPLAQIFSTPNSKTYPIGTNGNFHPVSLNLTTLNGTPSLTVTPHEPSSLGASVAGVPLFTNRNWTVASSVSSGNVPSRRHHSSM